MYFILIVLFLQLIYKKLIDFTVQQEMSNTATSEHERNTDSKLYFLFSV